MTVTERVSIRELREAYSHDMAQLDDELANGDITQSEYDRYARNLSNNLEVDIEAIRSGHE